MPRYDLFRIEADGRQFSLGTAEDLEQAKARIKVLALYSKREFCAIDEITGEKIVIRTGEAVDRQRRTPSSYRH
jgi:hypothetical protein